MLVRFSFVYMESPDHFLAKTISGKHALNRSFNHFIWFLGKHLFESGSSQMSNISGVLSVKLASEFYRVKMQLTSIDDYHMITVDLMGRVVHTIFTPERIGNQRRESSEVLPLGINENPFWGLWRKGRGFHFLAAVTSS